MRGTKLQEFKGKYTIKSEILKPAPKCHLSHLNITCTTLISCSSLFSTDSSLHGLISSNHRKIKEFALVGMQPLREAPSVTTHGTLCQAHSHHPTLSLPGPSSSSRSPPGSPHPTHTQSRFPHWFQPRFPSAESQISRSIKPFILSTVTQPQPKPVPLRRD